MLSTTFVAATKEYCDYKNHVSAPYLRRSFTLEKLPETAEITICGLGFYRLFINGSEITKGLLAPYISNPDDILYYDCYDLTSYLQTGINVIGIILGNGMLNCIGGTVWDFQKVAYRSAPKVAFSLEINNGEESVCITADEQLRTHASPILLDDLRIGEFYDAREEIEGWNLPEFDDSDWHNAIPSETPRGIPTLCTAEPIVTLKELSPVSVTPNKRAHLTTYRHKALEAELGEQIPLPEEYCHGYLYDFGENLAGNTVLRIRGRRGQEISILYGEMLTEEGDLNMQDAMFLPHFYDHRVTYTLKGDGVEEYTPSFSYQGFRYCLVAGLTPEQATKELLTYKVMSSSLQKNGDFRCSDELVNRLQRATYNADISNFFYFPTDCPHREKNGWTGDAALSAQQLMFNLTPANSFRVWLQSIRAAQRRDGALPGIVPTGGWGFAWGNGPAWDAVLFQLPYHVYKQTGDTETISENAGAMMHYLHYISTRRDEKGLLHVGLGDWLPTKYKAEITPLEVTDTLVTMNNCALAAKMFEAIGMTAQKDFALTLRSELRQTARRELLSPDGTVSTGTQTAQAMAIEYGLVDDKEIPAVFEKLMAAVREADGHMDLGCLGARIIFHVLSRYGEAETAFRMITREDAPSYGHWILSEGGTSLFEKFTGKPTSPGSKNHHFFGDISAWFFMCITGVHINPEDRDCNELVIAPHFISSLSFAEGYQNHPCGRIESRWERQGKDILLTLTVPDGCYGHITLPTGYTMTEDPVLKVGTHIYHIKGE